MVPKSSRSQYDDTSLPTPLVSSAKVVFGWLIAALTGFVALIYGDLTGKVGALEHRGNERETRLSKVETHVEHVNKELGDLHNDVGTINTKMDRLLDLIYRRDSDSKRRE